MALIPMNRFLESESLRPALSLSTTAFLYAEIGETCKSMLKTSASDSHVAGCFIGPSKLRGRLSYRGSLALLLPWYGSRVRTSGHPVALWSFSQYKLDGD